MNCQQYRQYCTIEPTGQEDDFLFHRQTCSECAAFTEETLQFEHALVEAMKVEIPANLTERILYRRINQHDLPRRFAKFFRNLTRFLHINASQTPYGYRHPIYALIASLLLIVSLFASGVWWWQGEMRSIKQDIIAHIENTAQLPLKTTAVPRAELQRMFQAIGARLTGEIGTVRFCKLLTLQDHNSAYMILAGKKGPINVFFIRHSQINGPQFLSKGELKGVILSTNWGNTAIVGVQGEPLEPIVERIDKAVKWL